MQLVLYDNGKALWTSTLLIPPESYQQTEITRANIQEGEYGGYVDLYGPALVQIQLQAVQTFKISSQIGNTDGYTHFKQFLDNIVRQYQTNTLVRPVTWSLHFYNWQLEEFFEVIPAQIVWRVAIPRQMAFTFDLDMLGIRRLSTPNYPKPNYWYLSMQNAPSQIVNNAINEIIKAVASIKVMLYGTNTNLTSIQSYAWSQSFLNTLPATIYSYSGNVLATNWGNINIPTLSNMATSLEGVLNTLIVPYQYSMTTINNNLSYATSIETNLNSLGVYPYYLSGMMNNIVVNLETLTNYPNMFLP